MTFSETAVKEKFLTALPNSYSLVKIVLGFSGMLSLSLFQWYRRTHSLIKESFYCLIDESRMQEEMIEDLDENDFSDKELAIAERLFEVMQQNQRTKLPALKEVNKNTLKKEVDKMNQLLAKVKSENISVKNDSIYAAAVVTTERLGVKINKKKYEGKPRWKERFEGHVKQLRKDLSRVEELRRGTKIKAKFEEELQRRYWIKERSHCSK